MPGPVDDHEGAMARSELYRAAKYSMKLFQMIQDGQELEGWVQAKITKSADYLDSVYHFMEYQTKFGDGSHASNIDDITGDADHELPSDEPVSDMDDEERKIDEMTTYEQKLASLLEGAVKEASGVRASDKKKGKVDKSERKQYFVKLEKDNKTRGMTIVADEGEREGELRDRVKRDNIGWTVASIRVKDEIDEAAEKISKAEKTAKNKKEKDAMIKEALSQVVEKAVSKAQQKFMGMVTAAKKGEKPASKEVAKTAKGMSKKDAEDFASTKHKGLPEKKAKKTDEGQEMMSPPDGATAAPKKDPKTGKYPKVTSGPNKGKEWSDKTPGPTNPVFKEGSAEEIQMLKNLIAREKANYDKAQGTDKAAIARTLTNYMRQLSDLEEKEKMAQRDVGRDTRSMAAPTNMSPAMKESNLVKSIVKKVVAEKKAGGKKPDANKDGIPDYAQDGKGAKDLGKDKGAAPKKGVNPFAKKDEKKESVNESADLARMKQFLTRLNG